MAKRVDPRARRKDGSDPTTTATKAASGDSVPGGDTLIEQFTREFSAVLQLAREKQSKAVSSEQFGGVRDDGTNAPQEVAYFGDIAQKLAPLVDKLIHSTSTTIKKAEVLLHFGDKFYQAKEFRAASMFFYEQVLELDDEMEAGREFTEKKQPFRARILTATAESARARSCHEGQVYVRSFFGFAMSCFNVHKQQDPNVRHPGRLEKMLETLTFLQLGMETAVNLEHQYRDQFAWLVLNGSVLIFSIAKPLRSLGYSREVVAYLKWCLLAMESIVSLSTTKYIMWRVQLGSSVCGCYEDMAVKDSAKEDFHVKSALACATYIQQIVQRLRREEEFDLPLPADVQRVLTQAETTTTMLLERTKAAATGQLLTRNAIKTAFSSIGDRIRIAIDGMESASRVARQKCRGQGVIIVMDSASSSSTNQALADLFSFVMDIVTPLLQPLIETKELELPAELSQQDKVVFPLSFHVQTIRYSFELGKSDDQMSLLIQSAWARVNSPLKDIEATTTTMVDCLLSLYEALREIRQSWRMWENISEDERLQSASRLNLPVSGNAIPSSELLIRLSKALQDCVFHSSGAIPRANRDLLTSVSLQMWREFVIPLINELDATEPEHLPKALVILTCELMLSVHQNFIAVDFEDLLLHGQLCLRLATLLSVRGKAHMGRQVVRRCLEQITRHRDELVDVSSHFSTVVDVKDDNQLTTSLSGASFSCSSSGRNNANSLETPVGERADARYCVGVQGTGSQLGGLHQDLCCVEVDLMLVLYRLELQMASIVNKLPSTSKNPPENSPHSTQSQIALSLDTETKLADECNRNGYAKVLLNIQCLVQPQKSLKARAVLADESLRLLQQMETQEDNLRAQLESSLTTSNTPDQHVSTTASTVPAPPIIISRSSSAIKVKVVEYHPLLPALRKKRVMYYMVFAKPAGAGTAVSLNSNQLAGTATPVYPPELHVTISGLLANESYVFAVAAFDSKHEIISSIGETSEPVVALNPMPLALCYGYLAKACHENQLSGRCTKAATYLYNIVVSRSCASRPVWGANPFYRQALQRDAVAQFPVPVLNLCIQSLLMLCPHEAGDIEKDGLLVSSTDLDAHPLTPRQTSVLEDTRKISIGIEIACATDNIEAIRLLCFKGYRLLLPLLHLKGSCDGLTFAALMTFYQALRVIPSDKWNVDTRSICARVGFELFRIAQDSKSDLPRVILPLLATSYQEHNDSNHPENTMGNEEDSSLREVMALFKLTNILREQAPLRDISSPATPAAPIASARGVPAKGAAASANKDKGQTSTPQATPRTGDNEKGEAEGKLQRLDELLQSAGYDLAKIFIALERHYTSDRRAIEFASKIFGAVLQAGMNGTDHMDRFLTSFKVTGQISNQFRTTLASLGANALLPDNKDLATLEDTQPPQDPKADATPRSARSGEDQPPSGDETSEPQAIDSGEFAGDDDEYLYRWCGELFFIQSVLLFRKITALRSTITTVDAANGPETEDCMYELLNGDNNGNAKAARVKKENHEALTASAAAIDNPPVDAQESHGAVVDSGGTAITPRPQDDELDRLFGQLIEKVAVSCKLFRLGHCWQGLQAVAQHLWNAIWIVWVPPSRMSTPLVRLEHLSSCVDALLDMMDTAAHGGRDQTGVSVNVDQTWLARMMAYSLKAFSSVEDWRSIVQKGSRYHGLCGGSAEGSRFSEQNFPILIYAQQQILGCQEILVQTAEEELNVYVKAFQEQEAKKKKKKSRLVVEEVLSPEEIAFQANKKEMEHTIHDLITVRKHEQAKLTKLSQVYDELLKTINKSHQALNACHDLVRKYHRLSQHDTDDSQHKRDELAALQRHIIASFNRCVLLSRQKRQKRIVCQALHETGDFHLACGDISAASKCWLESLDNAFSTLNVGTSWREILIPPADQYLEDCSSSSNSNTIAGDELWVGLQSCSALAKLVMHSSGSNLHKTIDYALMAVAIFTRFYGCSLPHPSKCFLFGSYRMLGQFWPGRKLLGDPDRVFPFSLGIMFVLIPEVLLQYEHQYAATAMPVIAGYEYVAANCLEDASHVANARRLRTEALVQCGRFHEAHQLLMELLQGGTKHPTTSAANVVLFHDSKSILDDKNTPALTWLSSFNAENTHEELKKHYHEALAKHVLVAILHFAVALARHEKRYDRDTAIARSAAKKMALAMLTLLKPNKTTGVPSQTAGDNATEGETQPAHVISWENLQLHRIRGDILLQLSYLAFYEGEWISSKTFSMDAMGAYSESPLDFKQPVYLDLDQDMKFSLLVAHGTFIAKCRSQSVACCLAQTHYRAAIESAQIAIKESKRTGGEHLRQHLELQRLQATVFVGERERAESELVRLRGDFLAYHTSSSLTYVRTLQSLSALLRSKALLSAQPSMLHEVCERLAEAEHILDAILGHDGWMGVSDDNTLASTRLNLYQPAVPDFVQVHADLAQALMECPLDLGTESTLMRQRKALRTVNIGLRALEHTTDPMAITRARLLLFKGVLLTKSLGTTTLASDTIGSARDEGNLDQQFEECVDAFTGCIQLSIQGGYDRSLVRLALTELVDLFGQKLIPGNEDAHVQAAFHYLNLGLLVQNHEAMVFDSLELQNGTITSVDKLPSSISAAIIAQSEAKEDMPSAPSLSTKAPRPPDTSAIVNFLVRLLRMQYTLPACSTALRDTCAFLHSFLIQNHSTYSRTACLAELPPVPSSDPEIRAGLVCALWGQDLAPAISAAAGEDTTNTPSVQNDKLTLHFTLGTTRVSIDEGSPAATNPMAIERMEKFASSPLLSKRCGLDRQIVQRLKTSLSKLRIHMEDDGSLIINRDSLPSMLHLILLDIQLLFRPSSVDARAQSVEDGHHQDARDNSIPANVATETLFDSFGNTVAISCTLEMVQHLEELFSNGASIINNELCYFLRDLLD